MRRRGKSRTGKGRKKQGFTYGILPLALLFALKRMGRGANRRAPIVSIVFIVATRQPKAATRQPPSLAPDWARTGSQTNEERGVCCRMWSRVPSLSASSSVCHGSLADARSPWMVRLRAGHSSIQSVAAALSILPCVCNCAVPPWLKDLEDVLSESCESLTEVLARTNLGRGECSR